MYEVKKVNDNLEWDNYVNNSPNGNIFFKSFFLNSINNQISKNFIFKGDQLKAAFILILGKKKNIVDNEIVIHSGIIFNRYEKKDTSNYNLEIYSITEFFVQYLVKNFNSIQFNTVPDFLDVRPFLWYNYNSKKVFFICYPKYTSFIDIKNCTDNIKTPNNLFHKLNTLRRRFIRKGIKNQTKFVSSENINYIVKSYGDYMIKQKSPVSSIKLKEMKKLLINLSKEKKLLVTIGLNKNNKKGYMCVFAYDANTSYYLYGCPLTEDVENYLGSITFFTLNALDTYLLLLLKSSAPYSPFFIIT